MESLVSDSLDPAAAQNLGRASLQIVHDIKNEHNSLKLYATYLRKRLDPEKEADLLATVAKLVAGLDRAAEDLNGLVRYGRPLALNLQPEVDVRQLMQSIAANFAKNEPGEVPAPAILPSVGEAFAGTFDAVALADALRTIAYEAWTTGASKGGVAPEARLTRDHDQTPPSALIEWTPVSFGSNDVFKSFNGSLGVKMSLAAKIIEAQGGSCEHQGSTLRVRLPLSR